MRRPIDETYNYTDQTKVGFPFNDAPPCKRRRTIVDAFKTITISTADAAIGSANNGITTDDSHDWVPQNDFMIGADDDDSVVSEGDRPPLSEIEQLERDAMRAIVFGTTQQQHLQPPQDPVEEKISNLIRGSLQQAIIQQETSHCDMDVETSYSRPSVSMQGVERRPRSNSLPKEWQSSDDTMDLD